MLKKVIPVIAKRLVPLSVRNAVRPLWNRAIFGPPREPATLMGIPAGFTPDFDDATNELFATVKPFTLTTPERVFALQEATRYIVRHKISGDFVECGVWRGGSMMAAALTLLAAGDRSRRLVLFDTFEGMPRPADVDVDFAGKSQREAWDREALQERQKPSWGAASLDDVQEAMRLTKYPEDQIVYVRGKVEETLPENAPDRIALLRLDTDWFESTYHELVHLYPRLVSRGVLLIDDYGHFRGARKAVDQYIAENHLPLLLQRLDYTGRICVKP